VIFCREFIIFKFEAATFGVLGLWGFGVLGEENGDAGVFPAGV